MNTFFCFEDPKIPIEGGKVPCFAILALYGVIIFLSSFIMKIYQQYNMKEFINHMIVCPNHYQGVALQYESHVCVLVCDHAHVT
jgi:hypothetical protein